jgi:SAM-dependent methyltransferase
MILKCRVCNSQNIKNVISLGFTPLANAFLTKEQLDQPEEKFPLDLVFCADCTLIQIVETVPPEKLFSSYFYVSSISQTTLDNAKALTEKVMGIMNLDGSSVVVEIGSNDGYLLKNYVEKGVKVIGFEPAKNIAEIANEKGIRTFNTFFDTEKAMMLNGKIQTPSSKDGERNFTVDVVHANNVLAHVANLHSVIEGIKVILAPNGVAIVETHYVKDLFDHNEFDCIYHEHLCYYSAHSIKKLFEIHGMTMVDVERIPMHGGSLRCYFQRTDGPMQLKSERVEEILFQEKATMDGFFYYHPLLDRACNLRLTIHQLLIELKKCDKKIAIYGAPAKSTTFLNFFGIDKDYIEYVVDATPQKQFHFTPGTHLPIYPPSMLATEPPDYCLLLTWNFADEIIAKESEFRAKGGKFIIPIPELKIV